MACFGTPLAFLHAKSKAGDVFMLLKCKLAELMTLVELKLTIIMSGTTMRMEKP